MSDAVAILPGGTFVLSPVFVRRMVGRSVVRRLLIAMFLGLGIAFATIQWAAVAPERALRGRATAAAAEFEGEVSTRFALPARVAARFFTRVGDPVGDVGGAAAAGGRA